MRNVNQLFRLMNEILFILAGGMLALFGLTGRFFLPRRTSWLVLAVVLILWGLRTWTKARTSLRPGERAILRIGGASLAMSGLIMLALVWAPLGWAGWLLTAAGGVFVLRGLVASVIAVRSA
jgi:hypothetical protein